MILKGKRGILDSTRSISIKDWLLIMGKGVATKRKGGGGYVKFYPYEKWGAETVKAMLKGGTTICWGSFYAVLAMLKPY